MGMILLSAAPGISASPSEENMRYFNVMILGPSQSPYEGNKLNIFVPIGFAFVLDLLVNSDVKKYVQSTNVFRFPTLTCLMFDHRPNVLHFPTLIC